MYFSQLTRGEDDEGAEDPWSASYDGRSKSEEGSGEKLKRCWRSGEAGGPAIPRFCAPLNGAGKWIIIFFARWVNFRAKNAGFFPFRLGVVFLRFLVVISRFFLVISRFLKGSFFRAMRPIFRAQREFLFEFFFRNGAEQNGGLPPCARPLL